ncbi:MULTISPECIES: right-handed parallel beta-helix repeat-containing protein [Protofrankia]|uniref:Parallel beta-helix repeat protein n=1 Tax=Candidatus Protofrankia datiscae TaxID=2716812 RepID=F8AWE0_9ACTN|nr:MULTISPECIES: right-handed parallel beta-helix repeat-containing protein [Protofrankia]AEH08341.1 parallel beta-helix repeat protein [Candidatus Protofrankia datiscae]
MAGRSDGEPAAFLSYAHDDDEHDSGLITAFRRRLEGELRAQTGRRELQIFQDRDDITWGQAWEERINRSLDAVTFFIPIVTPAFVASPQCRREMARFLDRERRLRRTDLILPVYWISVPELETPGRAAGDTLLAALAARQYTDWRERRFGDLSSPGSRRATAALARRIRDALAVDAPAPGTSFPGTPGGGAAGRRAGRPVRVHVVDALGRGDFTTVDAAIRAARPGDRVVVRPGLYPGPLILDKPLEIVGDGPVEEITVVAGTGSVVLFTAANGSVRGLTLRATGQPGEEAVVDIRTGRLVLDGCDISGSASAGVAVHNDADPHVHRCRVHYLSGRGVHVYDKGAGLFEDNDITDNVRSNIVVASGGNPRVRGNRITSSQRSGVFVYDNGTGLFENNDITGNARSNIAVRSGGNPRVHGNRITSSRRSGVFVHDNGAGLFENNDITGNIWPNVTVASGGNPTVRGNHITNSQNAGVHVYDNGAGLFENNDITGNARSNVAVESGGNPTIRRNRITNSQEHGVFVYDNGAGLFEDNDITGNRKSAWDVWGADRKRLVRR